MAFLELFSVIGSPIIGIAGAFFQRKHERKMYEAQTERMSTTNEHELKLTELTMKARAQEVEQELALTEVEGDFDILKAAINAESDLTKIKWGQSKLGDIGNFFRTMIRPTTTIYLCAIVSIFAGHQLIVDGLNQENRILMIAMIDAFLLTLSFWFGSREGKNSQTYSDGTYTRN